MAKRELKRKIIATVLTVAALCGGLALCTVLLLTSTVFAGTIRWLMLACIVGLGIATVGLLVCKIQEIRALRALVKSGMDLPEHHAPASVPEPGPLEPLQTLDEPIAVPPQPAAEPGPPAASVMKAVTPDGPVPVCAAPEEPAQPAHNWKPIDFTAVQPTWQAARAGQTAEIPPVQDEALVREARRMEAARQAEAARQEEAARITEAQRLTLQRAEAQRQARRAEQIRLAQQARTGQLPRITDEMVAAQQEHLAQVARQAEAQRLAKAAPSPAQAPAASTAVQPQAAPSPATAQAPAAPRAASAAGGERWIHGWQPISFDDDSTPPAAAPPAPAPQPAAAPASPQPPLLSVTPTAQEPEAQPAKLNVTPISWPAPPPSGKTLMRTGQLPRITDEMVEAAKAQAAAKAQTAGQPAARPHSLGNYAAQRAKRPPARGGEHGPQNP